MASFLNPSMMILCGTVLVTVGCSENTNNGKPDLGSVDAGSMTGNFTPCGGNPVGLWGGTAFELDEGDACTTKARYTTLPSAIFDIKADTLNITMSGNLVFESTVDVTCWTFPKTSCSEASSGDMTCTGEATACACTTAGEAAGGWEGSYSIVDNLIVVSTSDGPQSFPFCVDGSTLRIRMNGGVWTAMPGS